MTDTPRRCETCAYFDDGDIVGACRAPAPACFDELDRCFVLLDDGEHCMIWTPKEG